MDSAVGLGLPAGETKAFDGDVSRRGVVVLRAGVGLENSNRWTTSEVRWAVDSRASESLDLTVVFYQPAPFPNILDFTPIFPADHIYVMTRNDLCLDIPTATQDDLSRPIYRRINPIQYRPYILTRLNCDIDHLTTLLV